MNRIVARTRTALLTIGLLAMMSGAIACGGTEQDIVESEDELTRTWIEDDGEFTVGGGLIIDDGDVEFIPGGDDTSNVTHGALCSGVSTTCCEGSSYWNTTCTTSQWVSHGYCKDKKASCQANNGSWSCPTCESVNR